MVRTGLIAIAACALAFGLGGLVCGTKTISDKGALAEAYRVQRAINDSTQVVLAAERASRLELAGLVTAEKELNGRLLAGVKLKIARRDTVVVHDTLVTTLNADSTRVATFHDSTFAGLLQGTITAPPCCRALQLHYTLTRPAFSPEVGFVRLGDRYVASVVWQGEHVEVSAPFVAPEVTQGPRLTRWVEGGWSLTGSTPLVGGGLDLRLFGGVTARAAAQHTFTTGEKPRVGISLVKTF